MSKGRRGGSSGARQNRRAAKHGALQEAREQGCRCRAKVAVMEDYEGGMMYLEVTHQPGCKVKREEKDRA